MAKYADGLPLYRLSGILERHGTLSRQTLSGAVLRVAAALKQLLLERLGAHLAIGALMHMDETRVQVLEEPGRMPQSQSYMWVQRGGPPGSNGRALPLRVEPRGGGARAAPQGLRRGADERRLRGVPARGVGGGVRAPCLLGAS